MTGEIPILQRYSAGELGWRQACLELGLWSCNELYAMLEEHGMAPPAPLRDGAHEAMAARLLAAANAQKG